MGSIGAPEIIIIAVVAILLFGATKLPIFAKSLGESMRIFKREIKGDDKRDELRQGLPPVIADNRENRTEPTVVESRPEPR